MCFSVLSIRPTFCWPILAHLFCFINFPAYASALSVTFAEQDANSYIIQVRNTAIYPVTFQLELADSAKFEKEYFYDTSQTLMAGEALDYASVDLYEPIETEELGLKSLEVQGSLNIDEDYVYDLPCECNKKCKISQTFGGITHKGWQKYAVDFSMPEGTDFFAMRPGTVIYIKQDSTENCTSGLLKCEAHLNKILILHKDGSIAEYLHIKANSSKLNNGDTVMAGDYLAQSGNTGYSFGPHLHVAVLRINKNLQQITSNIIFSIKEENKVLTTKNVSFIRSCK